MRWYYFNKEESSWQESPDLPVLNRAFLYGDGFFDTMLLIDAVPGFWNYHKSRIEDTLTYLELDLQLNLDELMHELHHVIKSFQPGNGRLRLSFYRAGQGKYLPEENNVEIVAVVEPYDGEVFPLSQPQKIGVSEIQLPSGEFGNHKTIGKHMQTKVALESKRMSLADMALLNERGHLVETISSNIFMVNDGRIYTPPLRSGALAGVVRQVVLDNFDVVSVRDLVLDDLKSANKIFTTNSIAGIRSFYMNDKIESASAKEVLEKVKALQLSSVQDFLESLP